MRGRFFLIIVVIALLWGGGQGLYTAITNRSPKEYSIERYLNDKPPAKWLRLTGGVVDMTGLNYSSFLGVGAISEIYVPVRPAGTSADDHVQVLLATKDPALLQIAEKMRQLRTESDLLRFVETHPAEIIIPRQVEGLIRFGIELKDRDERKLRRLNGNLAKDFVVLAEGERPEYLLPGFLFLGGLALAGWTLMGLLGARAKPPVISPPHLPPRQNEVPPLLNPR